MTYQFKPSTATPEQIDLVRDLYADGTPASVIARALNVHRDTVRRLCLKHGDSDPYKEDAECKAIGIPKDDLHPLQVRKMTMAHLQDILAAHGYYKTWENYDIPPEPAVPLRAYHSTALSVCGSPATMCAEVA
jgi:hypothetical protein